jgi:hypothetical protein
MKRRACVAEYPAERKEWNVSILILKQRDQNGKFFAIREKLIPKII